MWPLVIAASALAASAARAAETANPAGPVAGAAPMPHPVAAPVLASAPAAAGPDASMPDSSAAAAAPSTPSTAGSSAVAPPYRVAKGDELVFRFLYAPELSTNATVRPDGRVALPLIGELTAEGLSISELTAVVEKLASDQVKRPTVVINVQGTTSQRIFVGGEVGKPGVQPMLGPLTVLQAVMVAEGFKDGAQPRDVLVLRHGSRGEQQVLRVDMAALVGGSESVTDVPLQPYDVVIVPRSGIANLDLWIDQYIRRLVPVSFGFSYSINRGGLTQ